MKKPSTRSMKKCLNLYWLDAYENYFQKNGKLYLTGRANVAGELKSCCLIVSNIPTWSTFFPEKIQTQEMLTKKSASG